MSATARRAAKAERTRARILAAAEQLFAERGFSDTRLDDVAAAAGLTRAALFYHFPDKRALYTAVLEDVFGALLARIESLLVRGGPLAPRVEAAVEAWVDAVGARPSIARILLREAAGARPDPKWSLLPDFHRFLDMGRALIADGRRSGELHPIRDDPFHVVSAVVGSTVFYVAALRSLLPTLPFDPLAPRELAAHKRDVVHATRRLLGIASAQRLRPSDAGGLPEPAPTR